MIARNDEIAPFTYLQWQDLYEREKPFQVFSTVPPEAEERRSTNLVFKEEEPETINDLRGQESQFTLDQNGFMVRHQEMPPTDLSTEHTIRNEYLPPLEELIKREVEGADYVHCFDWGIRRNTSLQLDRINVNDKMQLLEPAKQVHCDQSPVGALGRLRQQLPGLAEKAMAGRLRIINVWRPINHPVEDNALAVCDGQTIEEAELVEADHITRAYLGSTMYGLYSPKHRWYYLHRQVPEELLIFKIFDSDPNVAARCSLHASFNHRDVPESALPRESVEVRFLVITFPKE